MNDTQMDRSGLERILADSPLTQFLGLSIDDMDPAGQFISLRMPIRPEVERVRGSDQFQGGVIATLIDTTGVYALLMALGVAAPTIDMRVDYLRPATGPDLTATARIRRAGRSVGVVDIEVLDARGATCALGRVCYGTADNVVQQVKMM